MGEGSWGVPPHLLDQVSPFHIVLGRDLTVLQVGSSLRRLCPQVAPSAALEGVIEVVSPRGPATLESLRSQPRSLFVLKVRAQDLTLRGQVVYDEAAEVLLFVGSPWITELTTISDMGLTLEDFSVSDNVVDYLLLLQTQGTALAQAHKLADSLQRSTAELTAQARQRERLTRQLESVLNSAGEGIYGLDSAGTITFANETAARLVGLPREDMLGRHVDEVIQMEAPAPGAPGPAPAAPRQDEPARLLTGRHRRADGSFFDSECISAPIIEQGTTIGSVVVFRDITERRAVERMKDEFVSTVSHELRTPLTSIRGALGLLHAGAAGELPPRAVRMVEVATTSTDRLVRLINDILEVERMAAGKLVINPRGTSARGLLRTAAAEMAGLAESSGVSLHIDRAEGVVWADPDRVVQTLTNLVGNAIKFSPTGAAVRLEATANDHHVRFDVHDNGCGVPEEELESIFEHFRQVDSSDTRLAGGTGLGLAICRGLVERHGGRIWVTSAVGEGTTASFTLPSPRKHPRAEAIAGRH